MEIEGGGKQMGKKSRRIEGGKMACSVDISSLPEGCIAKILTFTSPRDVGRLSVVSPIFQSAAKSDVVWGSFLPSDYRTIISLSDGSSSKVFASKKKIYFHLCHAPILIDGGKKSFSLEQWSGKKVYMIAARDFIHNDDSIRWISQPGSRFGEAASGLPKILARIKTQLLSLETRYVVYLVFKVRFDIPNGCPFQRGWYDALAAVGLKGHCNKVFCLVDLNPVISPLIRKEGWKYANKRGDGWYELEMGEYININPDEELEMHLFTGETSLRFLIVLGIEIRPKRDL